MTSAQWKIDGRLTIILSLFFLSIAFPPEIYPLSRVLAAVLIIILGYQAARDPDLLFQNAKIVLFSLISVYMIINCILSFSPYESVHVVLYFFLLSILFLTFYRRLSPSLLLPVLTFITFCAAAISLYGAYQHFFGFEKLAHRIRSEPFALSDTFLAKIESGRAISTFMLPATLAGFLMMTIPLCVFLLVFSKTIKWRIIYGLLLLIQASAFVLSFSLAALAACVSSLWFIIFFRLRRKLLLSVITLIMVFLCASFFLWYRGIGFAELFSDGSPLMLRFGNWKAGFQMIRDHLLFGVGNGAYGIAFSQYREPWMNETHYAHNSFLQIVAENGLLSLFLLFSFLILFFKKMILLCPRKREELQHMPDQQASGRQGNDSSSLQLAPFISVSCLTFLFHNLLDFTFYQASVSFLFFALSGIFFSIGSLSEEKGLTAHAEHEEAKKSLFTFSRAFGRIIYAGMLGCVLIFFLSSFISDSYFHRSTVFLDRAAYGMADEMLVNAESFNPFNSEYRIYRAQLLIDEKNPERDLSRARDEALIAVTLDPYIPYYRKVLSDIYIMSGEPISGYFAIAEARRLYPADRTYRERSEMIWSLLTEGK